MTARRDWVGLTDIPLLERRIRSNIPSSQALEVGLWGQRSKARLQSGPAHFHDLSYAIQSR